MTPSLEDVRSAAARARLANQELEKITALFAAAHPDTTVPHGAPADPAKVAGFASRTPDGYPTASGTPAGLPPATAATQSAVAPAAVARTTAVPGIPDGATRISGHPHATVPQLPVTPYSPDPARTALPDSPGDTGQPTRHWWQGDTGPTRVLAILGASITVLGLTFLALLAWSSGLLGPGGGALLAAAVSVTLIVGSLGMHHHAPEGLAAPSLLVTGTLGALSTIWVTVVPLGWSSPLTGTILTIAVCGGATAISYIWQRQVLAVCFTILAPLWMQPIVVIHFIATQTYGNFGSYVGVLGSVALLSRLRRPWFGLSGAGAGVVAMGLLNTSDILSALVLSTIALGLLVLLAHVSPRPSRDHLRGEMWVILGATVLATARYPWQVQIPFIAGLAAVFSLLVLRLGAHTHFSSDPKNPTAEDAHLVLMNGSLIATIAALALNTSGPRWFTVASIGVAAVVVFFGVRFERSVPAVAAALGFAILLPRVLQAWLDYTELPHPLPVAALLAGLALVAATVRYEITVSLAAPSRRTPRLPFFLGALCCLVIGSSALLAVTQLVAPGRTTFNITHVVISVVWISLGVWAIHKRMVSLGLFLAFLATAKLVLYDLAALSGLVQVVAFILCGAILLGAAVVRERTPEPGDNRRPRQTAARTAVRATGSTEQSGVDQATPAQAGLRWAAESFPTADPGAAGQVTEVQPSSEAK